MRTVLLVASVVFSVCGDPQPFDPSAQAALDEPFALRVGRSAGISGTPLSVRFDQVAEDSRCPSDVACVWSGNARVLITAVADGRLRQMELNTGLEPRDGVVAPYVVRLEALQPIPSTSSTVAAEEYVATFRVTESNSP